MIYWLKSLFKSRRKAEKQNYEHFYKKICDFLSCHNAKLISFKYFHEYFGSMILQFEYDGTVHLCECEKGQIFLNGKLMDNGTCCFSEADDRMIEIIETRVFNLKQSPS